MNGYSTFDIERFLQLYIQNDEKCGIVWEKNTKKIFVANLADCTTIKKEYRLKKTIEYGIIVFYFVEITTANNAIINKIFCMNKETGCIGYPVNFLTTLLDYSNTKKIVVGTLSLKTDFFSRNIGKKEITLLLEKTVALMQKAEIIVKQVDIVWLSKNNPLHRLAKKSAFFELASETIFIFSDIIVDEKILFHEIVHMFFWDKYKVWPRLLFREGAAEAFFSLEYYKKVLDTKYKDYSYFYDVDYFKNEADMDSAVFLGLFCKFLISEYGLSKFFLAYGMEENSNSERMYKAYGCSIGKMIQKFEMWRVKVGCQAGLI